MAFSLIDPATWGWGSDYPTGQSASLSTPIPNASTPSGPAYYGPPANTSTPNGQVYTPPSNTYRGVLGDSTSSTWTNNSSVPTASTSTAPSQSGPSPEDQARTQYFSYLDSQAGMLPETQRTLENNVNSLFSGSKSSIDTATAGSLGDLNLSSQKVDSNKASSIRDLEQNMRNQLSAGQKYLGGIPGAANSTAGNMYNYALGKIGNQNRANLLKQTNELHANIDNQVAKVKATAQDQLNQLDTWKNTQLSQIAQYIQQQRGQIDAAKANYIQSQLQNIDAQATAYKQSLTQWAMNNSTTLEGLKQKLAGFAQGNPTDIKQPIFNGQITFNSPMTSGSQELYGNYANKKRELTPGQPVQYLA